MNTETRLKALRITMPNLPTPTGNYVPKTIHNSTIYHTGEGPILVNGELATGIVGRDVTMEQAYSHTKRAGPIFLAGARRLLSALDRLECMLDTYGIANITDDFPDYPKLINGCSDLMFEVFGEAGRHARAVVGMGTLRGRVSVETTEIFAVKP